MRGASITEASVERPALRLGVAVFWALSLASFAAFFLAQRLKHTPTAVQQLKFDAAFYPQGGGNPAREAISFEIERRDLVTVRILNAAGAPIATLARERPLRAYTPSHLYWNGRRGAPTGGGAPFGPLAAAGEYRVAVSLARRKVEVRSPSGIELVRRSR